MLIVFTTITTQSQTKLLSSIKENYDGTTWQKNTATNYTYIDGTTLTSETELIWDNGVWKNSCLNQYITNFFSKKTTRAIYSKWNDITNKFESIGIDSYTYTGNPNDTNVKLLEIVSYDVLVPGDLSTQTNEYKIVISYGSNNLPDTVVYYNWNGTQWVNDEKETYTYNTNNKVISDISQKWSNSQWVNSRKALYTYNANNKLTTVEGAVWDKFNNNWKADANNAFEYVLDAQGNRISSNESNYESNYTYDTTQLMSNFAHPFRDKTGLDYFTEDYPYINKLLTETNNNGTTRITYNYNSAITLSVNSNEIIANNIAIYPNPTNSTITISQEISNLEVFDIAGKKVKSFQKSSSSFDVSNLEKGVYILKGKTIEGKSINEKLVKE